MSTMAFQITSLTIVYSTVYSGANQRKHQSSASLAFVSGIHRWPRTKASNEENISIWWRHHAYYINHVVWFCFKYAYFLQWLSWSLVRLLFLFSLLSLSLSFLLLLSLHYYHYYYYSIFHLSIRHIWLLMHVDLIWYQHKLWRDMAIIK